MENIHIGESYSPEEIELYIVLFIEFHDIFAWSYEEIPRINPQFIIHEIKTYPGAKPVRKRLCLVHPKKVVTIKVAVEKLIKASFIYHVPLTEWVLNICFHFQKTRYYMCMH